MISFDHKTIFIHLKRTGGNSIEAALGGLVLLDQEGREASEWNNRIHRDATRNKVDRRGTGIHDTALEVRKRYPKEFDEFFKFSVVRNPYAQVFSLYRRMRHKERATPERFERYLNTIIQKKRLVPKLALCDRKGRNLMDDVMRFEDLEGEFRRIARRIGLEDTTLPVFNRSHLGKVSMWSRVFGRNKTSYHHFYTPAARRWVEDTYGDDIERYGYCFEGLTREAASSS